MLRGDEEGCFGSSNGGGDSSQSPDRRGKQGPVGRNRSEDTVKGIGIGSAATKLTDKILGRNTDDLADIMKDIAAECGLSHIAYLCLAADKSAGLQFIDRCYDISQRMASALFYEAIH